MKIYAIGAESNINQIDRIRAGFVQLGHELVTNPQDADIIYSNNPWFDKEIELKKTCKAKFIFNILDIPIHIVERGQYDTGKLIFQLMFADAITTISHKVKDDIMKYLGVESSVIYNPAKDVFKIKNDIPRLSSVRKSLTEGMFVYVGRVCDPNKRFFLAAQGMKLSGFAESSLTVCGSENPNFGEYLGIVSDEKLNEVYNNCEYVFLTSHIEGLGLPMIEAMICGKIPIVCNDNLTAKEILGDELYKFAYKTIEPNPNSIADFICLCNLKLDIKQKIHYLIDKRIKEIGNNFTGQAVANKIIKVYEQIR